MSDTRDLVICGIYRSGTTILAEMLSNHPDIFMSSELGTYILQAGTINNKLKTIKNEYPHIGECIFPSTVGLTRDTFKKFIDVAESFILRGNSVQDKRKLMLDLIKFSNKDVKYHGDKLPEYVFHINHINTKTNKPKFLFCVRDPRDVIASQIRRYSSKHNKDGLTRQKIKQSHFWCQPDWESAVEMRNSWYAYVKEWDSKNSNVDGLCIRYEDLMTKPQETARKMSKFLGVSDVDMIEIVTKLFHPIRVGSWKEVCPDIKLPESWKKLAAKYGYEV